MLSALLVRGLLAGLGAGLVAAGVAGLAGEPYIGQAIALEEQVAAATGAGHEHGPVSREVQSTAGLFLAFAIYGLAVGGLFALAFAVVYGRVANASPARTALGLAGAAFVVVALVTWVKYPPNPPAVGSAETIGERTLLYLVLIAISILAAVAAVRVGRLLGSRGLRATAAVGAAATFAVLVGAAGLALPGVDEVPADFPAGTLWGFRLASLGTQFALWAVLGAVFAAGARRVMARTPRGSARTASG